MWNVADFVTNALYLATIALRLRAYYDVSFSWKVTLQPSCLSRPTNQYNIYCDILGCDKVIKHGQPTKDLMLEAITKKLSGFLSIWRVCDVKESKVRNKGNLKYDPMYCLIIEIINYKTTFIIHLPLVFPFKLPR